MTALLCFLARLYAWPFVVIATASAPKREGKTCNGEMCPNVGPLPLPALAYPDANEAHAPSASLLQIKRWSPADQDALDGKHFQSDIEDLGCFPRVAGDPQEVPEDFRDYGCVDIFANASEVADGPCHSGLPFFRLIMQKGQSFLDCMTFCTSKGLDLFGLMRQSFGFECRCGGTATNKAVWGHKIPKSELQLPLTSLPSGDERCAMLAWRYTAGLSGKKSPWGAAVPANDLEYVYSIAESKRLDLYSSDIIETPINNTLSFLSTTGLCEDFDKNNPHPHVNCGTIDCRNPGFDVCAFYPGGEGDNHDPPRYFAYWCCAVTCGFCTKGEIMPCAPKTNCADGTPWRKNADGMAVINFYFTSRVDETRKAVARRAAKYWEEGTCIRFQEIGSSHKPCVKIDVPPGGDDGPCSSGVGYPGNVGETTVNLGWCRDDRSIGNVVHELGHTLGMGHEQHRPDALKSVFGHGPNLEIFWHNIAENWKDQWKPHQSAYVGSKKKGYVPYDFASIMHYPKDKGFRTLPDGLYDDVVGNRAHISAGDIEQIKDMYDCGCRVSVVAGAGGFDLTDPEDPIAQEHKQIMMHESQRPEEPNSFQREQSLQSQSLGFGGPRRRAPFGRSPPRDAERRQASFDPTSPLTSYHDEGTCGPRGDDAKEDCSQCANGCSRVDHAVNHWNIVATINGCEYYEYAIYECNQGPGCTSPTADFMQSNLAGSQAKVTGHAVSGSNFIFSWNDGGYRKMVLTDATGQHLKHGYVGESASTWTDTNTWASTGSQFWYAVSNFQCDGQTCKDNNVNCQAWTTGGYCQGKGYDQFMEDHCKLSCGKCGPGGTICDRMHWFS